MSLSLCLFVSDNCACIIAFKVDDTPCPWPIIPAHCSIAAQVVYSSNELT